MKTSDALRGCICWSIILVLVILFSNWLEKQVKQGSEDLKNVYLVNLYVENCTERQILSQGKMKKYPSLTIVMICEVQKTGNLIPLRQWLENYQQLVELQEQLDIRMESKKLPSEIRELQNQISKLSEKLGLKEKEKE